jgi:CAAX prenyl protease-like protein
LRERPWLPYVLPFALFFAFLAVQTPERLPWIYPLKTVVVGACLLFFWRAYEELRPRTGALPGVVVGAVAIAIWIAIDPYYPGLSRLTGGTPAAPFDPASIADSGQRSAFLAFRVVGAVVVVPLMEELFWRAFLIRWLVNEDWKSVPVGTYTHKSFAITTLLFAVEHEQWLAGLLCGALYNGLLYRTRSVFACVVAHATSNALLAAWVLLRQDWKFW